MSYPTSTLDRTNTADLTDEIEAYLGGRAATVAQIAKALGVDRGRVTGALRTLVADGYVRQYGPLYVAS